MFGRIVEIDENTVLVENKSQNLDANYINYHVVFNEAEDRKSVV